MATRVTIKNCAKREKFLFNTESVRLLALLDGRWRWVALEYSVAEVARVAEPRQIGKHQSTGRAIDFRKQRSSHARSRQGRSELDGRLWGRGTRASAVGSTD